MLEIFSYFRHYVLSHPVAILLDSLNNEEELDTTMSSIESEAPTTQSNNGVCSKMVGEYCLLDMEPGTSINGTATISQTDVKVKYYTFPI